MSEEQNRPKEDGILNQLRNSGELRYFKSSELQAEVGKLSVMIANIRNRNDKEYSFIEMQLRPFTLAHYDFDWYQAFTQNGKLTMIEAQNNNIQLPYTGKIISPETFRKQEAENIISYYLLMLRGQDRINMQIILSSITSYWKHLEKNTM